MTTQLPQTSMGKGVIVLTYACNLKCSFCYAASEVFDRPGTMSVAEGRRSIDFLESIGIRSFTLLGGEPTVYKHLVELVEYSREKGMGPWVVTNGTRICEEGYARSLVEAGLKGGCISLHGHTPEEHDRAVRIPGSYASALKAIALAVEHDWPLFPMFTVMDSNKASVMKMVNSLREVGCRKIYINYGLPNVVPALDTGIDASPQALARLTEELFLAQDDLGVRFIFNREKNKIPLCHFNHDILKDMFEAEGIGTGCEAAQGNTVVVEPGGSLLGCSHWVEHPLLNIYEDYKTLKLISPEEFWRRWQTGRPREFREELRYFPYEQCTDCGWRKDKKCFGGCKVWQKAGVLPKHVAFDGEFGMEVPASNPILARLSLPILSEIQ
jgi:radical SAM protein with 4Fe4S-binding SPASM domain